jgi:hypothetical protein
MAKKHKTHPMENAVSPETLGIDWNRAEQNAARMHQMPVTGDPIADMEKDLTGLLSSEDFKSAIRKEKARRG